MTRIALRGLRARPARLLLTLLAVALGVTLVAGTYVFTDTINRAFERIFTASQQGTDVALTPREVVQGRDEDGGPTLPAGLVARVRQVSGVAAAEGGVQGVGAAFGPDGERLGTSAAPSFVFSLSPDPRFDASLEVVDGRRPGGRGEALLDRGTAERSDVAVGDTITVQGAAGRERLRVVGLSQIAGVSSLGGTVAVTLPLPEAQRVLGRAGRLDAIQVAAEADVTPQDLTRRVREAVGRQAVVRTGEAEADQQAASLREDLGFLNTALLAFAGISLFVGAFLIYNTFAITLAQRTRELALLRTLGASRGQVLRSVLAEGLVIGVVGAAIGLGLGILAATGLKSLFSAVGVELPSSGAVIATRTVVVSLAAGVLVTLVAAAAPALRATRVAPIAALQAAAAPAHRPPSGRMAAVALALTALGVALLCGGLFGPDDEDTALSLLGAGALVTFLGVALVSPHLVRPLAALVGAPIQRLGGLTGRLARENAVRQPARTATTAAALMIGVALVAFAAIFASSARATIEDVVQGNLRAEVVVQNEDGFSPFPAGALRRAGQAEGVAAATGIRFAIARLGRERQPVSGIDPAAFPRAYAVDEQVFGTLRAPDTAILTTELAREEGLRAGDRVVLTSSDGTRVRLRVTGTFDDDGRLTAPVVTSIATIERRFGEQRDAFGLVVAEKGAEAVAVRRAVSAALERDFPVAQALTGREFVEEQAGQVDQLLGLIVALLSLSLLVSLVGIVNTLVLSVRERTRELGLLRAIGTSRRQVRATVRWEALITALIGAVLGLALGTVLAVLFTTPLDDFVLAVPVPALLGLLVLAGLAGVVAATWPARRAAKLDVLQALAHE